MNKKLCVFIQSVDGNDQTINSKVSIPDCRVAVEVEQVAHKSEAQWFNPWLLAPPKQDTEPQIVPSVT